MKAFILLFFILLSGCASCAELLDADLSKYGRDIALTKYDSCNRRRMASAAAFQHGMDGVANNFQQRANSYSNQLPRTFNINQY